MIYIIILKKRGGGMRFNHVFHQSKIIAKWFSITNNITTDGYLEFIHIHILMEKYNKKPIEKIVNLINNNKKWEVNQEYIRLHNILIVGRYWFKNQ